MYRSEKIKTHLHSVKFAGDAEKGTLACSFYITPLSFDILYEIDDQIAKQLFRREGKEHNPVGGLGKTLLNLGELPTVNLEIYPHNEEGSDGAGQMIPSCKITEVSCDKLFTDDPKWSLIWKAILPLDSNSLALVHKYYKKDCFITLVEAQEELELEADDKKPIILSDAEVECGQVVQCHVCEERANWLGVDMSGWCDQHLKGAIGIQVRKIKYVGDAA